MACGRRCKRRSKKGRSMRNDKRMRKVLIPKYR